MTPNIRSKFPQYHYNPSLIYLDSAASSLTPQCVIDSMTEYYSQYRANVHRGIYPESMRATEAYHQARETVAEFIGAGGHREIIFTRGATDGLNMLSELLSERFNAGDNIVTTIAEHHSNFLPWQQLARKSDAEFRVVDLVEGMINEQSIVEVIDESTQIVAVSQVSNVLGNILDLSAIIEKAHTCGAIVVLDGCQGIPHLQTNVVELGVDAYVFSGHKVYGPTGIGVLYVREELLKTLNPQRVGGGMVSQVIQDGFVPSDIPERFEPGTPPIAEAIGLARALEFVNEIGWDDITHHEQEIINYIWDKIGEFPWLRILGPKQRTERTGCFSFVLDGLHPGDVTQLLCASGIALRGGHHCAEPLSLALGIGGSARMSIGVYTNHSDIDTVMQELERIHTKFATNS